MDGGKVAAPTDPPPAMHGPDIASQLENYDLWWRAARGPGGTGPPVVCEGSGGGWVGGVGGDGGEPPPAPLIALHTFTADGLALCSPQPAAMPDRQ